MDLDEYTFGKEVSLRRKAAAPLQSTALFGYYFYQMSTKQYNIRQLLPRHPTCISYTQHITFVSLHLPLQIPPSLLNSFSSSQSLTVIRTWRMHKVIMFPHFQDSIHTRTRSSFVHIYLTATQRVVENMSPELLTNSHGRCGRRRADTDACSETVSLFVLRTRNPGRFSGRQSIVPRRQQYTLAYDAEPMKTSQDCPVRADKDGCGWAKKVKLLKYYDPLVWNCAR